MKKFLFLSILIYAIIVTTSQGLAESFDSRIIVDPSISKEVNPLIFGNNAVAYDPCSYEKSQNCKNKGAYSNFGAGQWDPNSGIPFQQLIEMARAINITILRFPGGCGSHNYNWKATIGDKSKRPLFQFGLDEFLSLCSSLKAQPLITMSYFTGTDEDLVDMVEYLNNPLNNRNPNGGIDWAQERAKNGHPEPYNVKYFEFGNEVYHGNHRMIKEVNPTEYARRYLNCREKCKNIDLNIQLGIVFQGWSPGMTSWDRRIAEIVRSNVDFAIMHIYPIGYRNNNCKIPPENLFTNALEATKKVKFNLEKFTVQLRQYCNRNVSLSITEYNGDFIQDLPVPYRHSLGNALVNASLIQTFLYSQAPVLCTNYWQFSNSYWGMVYNNDYLSMRGNYTKRPNYYLFELFAKHFGPILIKAEANQEDIKDQSAYVNPPENIDIRPIENFVSKDIIGQNSSSFPSSRYLTVAASTNKEHSRIFIFIVNKNMQHSSSSLINLKKYKAKGSINYWTLNGPSVDSTNEKERELVGIKQGSYPIVPQTSGFTFTFLPHSITFLEIEVSK